MNDLYDRWIEALEANEYLINYNALKIYPNRYSNLGVLCDIVDPSKWESPVFDTTKWTNMFSYDGHTRSLPHSIAQKVNLRDINGTFDTSDLSDSLQRKIEKALSKPSTITSLREIHDIVDNHSDETVSFDLTIEVLKERPPSLFIYQREN